MAEENNKLSTTALAKLLGLPVQQLFATLKDYGWIERAEQAWVLTPKGEYEGGSYQTSKRYGRYIVWPKAAAEHPLLSNIESQHRVTAAGLQRYFPLLGVRHINRALAELGLQRHTLLGWELTDFGKTLGGQQEESNSSGVFYVTWPSEIVDNPVLQRELSQHSQPFKSRCDGSTFTVEPDLFAGQQADAGGCCGVDGHNLANHLELEVCNWLYLAQLAHAYRRALPCEEQAVADFYLPAGNIYIDCWPADIDAATMKAHLRRRELYKLHGLRYLEVNAEHVGKLDEALGRALLEFGIRF